jgi:hypothetical protein
MVEESECAQMADRLHVSFDPIGSSQAPRDDDASLLDLELVLRHKVCSSNSTCTPRVTCSAALGTGSGQLHAAAWLLWATKNILRT